MKITYLIVSFLILSVAFAIDQSDLDEALEKFHQKRATSLNNDDLSKLANDQTPVDRTNSKFNMRRTSKFAKHIHDTITFANEFVKRQMPPNPGMSGYDVKPNFCPYKNITTNCNSAGKYRTFNGVCKYINNLFLINFNFI
jgi:hypothetical protein